MAKIITLLLLTMALFEGVGHADSSFRCGSEIVSLGDTIYEVLTRCGAPDFRDYYVISVDETWVYDCGPQSLLKILVFTNSRLTEIETGRDYGTRQGLPCPSNSDWVRRKELARSPGR